MSGLEGLEEELDQPGSWGGFELGSISRRLWSGLQGRGVPDHKSGSVGEINEAQLGRRLLNTL